MGAHICKIALKTIPRCGVAVLILLCLGLYFLFPACQTFQRIQAEKNTPFELTATTESGSIDLNTLLQIEGVEWISPVMNLNASLSLDDFKLDCEIRAVYSSFIRLKFTEGTMYPNSSNMPYLILNKAAANSFAQEYQTMTVSVDDTVIMNIGGTGRKATVCGVFDDGSETPIIYMSYDVAQKEYGYSGQTELLFLLEDKGAAEAVVSALQRQNIYADFDPSLTLAWEVLQKQCWQMILLSISLLVCASALIWEKRTAEISNRKSEEHTLLLTGLTFYDISIIYPLRMALTGIVCALLAFVFAMIAGTFSSMAIFFEMCIIALLYAVTIVGAQSHREN